MLFSRNNVIFISIITLQIIALTVIWLKLDNRNEYASSSEAEILSKLIITEIKKFKTATQTFDSGPSLAAVSVPDSEQIRTVIREVLEKELSQILNSPKFQNVAETQQNNSNESADYSSNQLRGKTEEPLSYENSPLREQAMSQTTTILDEAIASGNWDSSNNEKIMPYIDKLSNEQRIELLEKFHGAINNQALSLTDGIPPPF